MISKAFVFIDGLEASPVVCAKIAYDHRNNSCQFVYGKSYLARKDAFALDPINLPLSENTYSTKYDHGLFGALNDAGADSWGKQVILSLHTTKPKNELEFLLAGSGMGVGALVFSLSSTGSKRKHSKNTLGDIPVLLKGKDAILNDKEVSDEAKKAFEYGSSMGGARPKTLINDNGIAYLAKFNRDNDLFNTVRVEHASMQMLSELPCRVAPTRVCETQDGDVLLVERFDVQHEKPICHFLSANSIFNTKKVNQSLTTSTYTYGFLAQYILKHGSEPKDAHDLYYRMAFNAYIGNTDDHARNHALMYIFESQGWRLTPAYDVLPIGNSRLHGIGMGDDGRHATDENLLSQSERFGLKQFKAKRILAEVKALAGEWLHYFKRYGVTDQDMNRLGGIIPSIS